MRDIEIEIIQKMCECNMNISSVARELYLHRNSVAYNLEGIKKKYGLDPCCFWDLVKLAQIAGAVTCDESSNLDILLKALPPKKRDAIQAVLTAKTVIVIDTEEEKE